uniref:Uncharacterized protein n=1 Tax=Anguilla anguilla TaxID=7936 RepID=A0A0E9SMN1_ANGAN
MYSVSVYNVICILFAESVRSEISCANFGVGLC